MTNLRTLVNEPAVTSRRLLSKLRSVARRRARRRDPKSSTLSDHFAEPIRPVAPSDPPGATIVLLNDSRDLHNYGAKSNPDGLIGILSLSAPNATLLPIPSHWLIDTSFGLGAFVNDGVGMRQPRATYPKVADEFEAVAEEWMLGRGGPGAHHFLTRLEDADVVVVNGEGSVYRDNLSAIREMFLAWLAKARLGIPTIFVNGTVHLTDVVPVLPAMVRKTFSALDAVAVREPRSLRNLREYVPDLDVQMVPDTAFFFTSDDALETRAVREVRAQIGDVPYFCFDPGPMPMDARDGQGSALHQLISALKRVTPGAAFVASATSDRYIEKVARETGSLYVDIDTVADYREYMALVADAQFVVTGRYHNAILAAIMGCPAITLASTSHKVHGACELLEGLAGSPYDATYVRPHVDAIEQQARAYVGDRADLSDRLQEVCARRRSETLKIGRLVDELVPRVP